MRVDFRFELGDKVKDSETGQMGVVVGFCVHRDRTHSVAVARDSDRGLITDWLSENFLVKEGD